MSGTNENQKGKGHDLPLPLLVLAVIGLVIIGVFVAFGNKIFKKKSDSAALQDSQDQEAETQEPVPDATETNEEEPRSEESVFTAPEQIPDPNQVTR